MPISQQLHFLMATIVLATIAAGILIGKTAQSAEIARSRAKLLGMGMIALWVTYNAYYLQPAVFTWHTSLPLHVCDLLGPCSAIAVAWGNRPARTVLYFCGIALAGQAIFTPTGDQDPGRLRFWLYWALHAGILALSAYDLVVMRYRPTYQDFRTMVVVDILYALLIVPVNITFGWNYGYLGDAIPDTLTAIQFLGPWPGRIGVMLAIVVALQAAMLAPWLLIRPSVSSISGEGTNG